MAQGGYLWAFIIFPRVLEKVIVQLEFRLVYYDVAVQYISHYAIATACFLIADRCDDLPVCKIQNKTG